VRERERDRERERERQYIIVMVEITTQGYTYNISYIDTFYNKTRRMVV
jgi:hypothetical protein